MDKRRCTDRKAYLIDAVRRRRKKVRLMAVAYLGGRCQRCSYDRCVDVLEIHHNDPTKKSFGISDQGYTRSWTRVREELKKCILICANCHREVHSHTQLPVEKLDDTAGEIREAPPIYAAA